MGFPNQWTRFNDLQVKYNTTENTTQKDYIGIIGSNMPHKELCNFTDIIGATTSNSNEIGQVAYSLAGGVITRGESYKEPRCYSVENSTLEVLFDTPQDFTSLYNATNNYANITHGENGTDDANSLFLVVNFKHNTTVKAGEVFIDLKAGATKYARLNIDYRPVLEVEKSPWIKMQFKLDNTTFSFNFGFTQADFKKITKVFVSPTDSNYRGTYYFQNLYVSLPKMLGDNIGATTQGNVASAYYPDTTNDNAIFVSKIIGNDEKSGTTKTYCVKTLAKAVVRANENDRTYIVIIDSETYKENIYMQFNRGTFIIADYLETPTVSNVSGVSNKNIVGARTDYRYRLIQHDSDFTGTIITVAKTGGDYDNIGDACSFAVNGDCIEIIDNGVYEESVVPNKDITIQARAGCVPVIKMPIGTTLLIVNSYIFKLRLFGITFQGNGVAGETAIVIVASNNYVGDGVVVQDCTFRNFGATTGDQAIIFDAGFALSSETDAINCLFENNGQECIVLRKQKNAYVGFRFFNCIYSNFGKSGELFIWDMGETSFIIVDSCEVTSILANTEAYFYNCFDDTYTTDSNYASSCNVFFTKTNGFIYCDQSNHNRIDLRLYNNYFYTENNMSSNNNCSRVYLIGGTDDTNLTPTYSNYYFYDNVFNGDINSPNEVRAIFVYLQSANGGNSNEHTMLDFQQNTFCNFKSHINLNVHQWQFTPFIDTFYFSRFKYNIHKNAGSVAVYMNAYSDSNVIGSIFEGGAWAGFCDNYGDRALRFTDCINYAINNFGPACELTNIYNGSALFLDSVGTNNSYLPNSPIETYGNTYSRYYDSELTGIINMGETVLFLYLKFEGQGGKSFYKNLQGLTTFYFCEIYGHSNGIDIRVENINVYGCRIYNNGIGIRVSSTIPTAINTPQKCLISYNIITDNGTGVELIKGSDIYFNTLENNGYGIYGNLAIVFGYTYMSQFVNINYNIIALNTTCDYRCEVKTDFNLIGSRYFDTLPLTDINYLLTAGTSDLTGSPKLTSNYYPQTIYNGYEENSPVFCYSPVSAGGRYFPASNGSETNIGARYYNYIKAVLSGDNFTFSPLSQPYSYRRNLESINLVENNSVAGKYSSYQDISRVEVVYGFGSAGEVGKLDETELNVFKYLYDTFWIVGIRRFTNGAWTYHKVKRSQKLSYSTQWTLYDNMPAGDLTIALIPMPSSFNIDDYTTEIGV